MADIGLNPPKAHNLSSRTGVMGDALAKFGSVLVAVAAGGHADMQTTTSAGATAVQGVVTSQGDPNNSDLFAVGDEVSVRDLGFAEVQVVAGTYAVGDPLITSTVAGCAKKRAAETGADILGYAEENITTTVNGQRISARISISRAGA
jgi:hypothetical protein